MSDYINELNDSQRAAVLYNDGPSLVIAGAGSGKTRVLTYKIAYLLEQGYRPWNILALTFTNKAAREMKERIARQVGRDSASKLWMGTFHSMFLRILRTEADVLGFPRDFTVYDTSDQKSLIRTLLKEMKLDEKTYKPGLVQSRISNAKNHLVTPAAYANSREAYEADNAARVPALRDVYKKYWERCRQSAAMDFDDLLLYTFLLFRDHPDVLEKYRAHFQYILVDEYQDTNLAQHAIVCQLGAEHSRDPDLHQGMARGEDIQAGAELPLHAKHRRCGQQPDRKEPTANPQGSLLEEGERRQPRRVQSLQ